MGDSHDEAIQQAYDAYDDLMLDKRYIRANDAWGDLRIDRENGAISLLLRWKYNWIKRWDAKTDWTDMEKKPFMEKLFLSLIKHGIIRFFYPFLGSLSLSVSLMVRIYLAQ